MPSWYDLFFLSLIFLVFFSECITDIQLLLVIYVDLFVNTKADCGPCPKLHSPALKSDFESHGDKYMFDRQFEREFSSRVQEVDRIIEVNLHSIFLSFTLL